MYSVTGSVCISVPLIREYDFEKGDFYNQLIGSIPNNKKVDNALNS